MNDPTIAAILTKIEAGERFLVASHEGPDGDAIASTLALTLALRQMGKDVVAFNKDGVPLSLRFLPGAETIVAELPEQTFDVGFILDAGELRRAGSGLAERCRDLVNIDHHPHSEPFGSANYVDIAACATGALVYRILQQGQVAISQPVATCVYAAVLADTGSFRYSNANPEAFRIAGEMIEHGVSPWEIASGLYENQEEVRLRLLGRALDTLTLSADGRLGSVAVTTEMLREAGAGPEHTDSFVNYPRAIRGVEVGLFFRQTGPTQVKVGFRSKGKVDVGSLARALGGGGHHNAAGAVIEGTLESVQASVLARLETLLTP
ncbi:MAG: bifunctional oligoribonuclease/PAP phosphatase NrnA [Desulfuromonadales bacterium]